jgi:phosphate/sulfate permease
MSKKSVLDILAWAIIGSMMGLGIAAAGVIAYQLYMHIGTLNFLCMVVVILCALLVAWALNRVVGYYDTHI